MAAPYLVLWDRLRAPKLQSLQSAQQSMRQSWKGSFRLSKAKPHLSSYIYFTPQKSLVHFKICFYSSFLIISDPHLRLQNGDFESIRSAEAFHREFAEMPKDLAILLEKSFFFSGSIRGDDRW